MAGVSVKRKQAARIKKAGGSAPLVLFSLSCKEGAGVILHKPLKIPLNPPLEKGDLKTGGVGEYISLSYNLVKKVKSSRFKVQS